MSAHVIRADARRIPLADESVDVVATSPPFYLLRSYRDGGNHYAAQIGGEPTMQGYVDALLAVVDECARVLKPSGSMFFELGDKYSGAGGPGGDYDAGGLKDGQPRMDAQSYWSRSSPQTNGVRAKSLMGLPWRFALGCIDRGLILRAEIVWSRLNGLPESVTDRVRRSHTTIFHFTKSEHYYSAVDELREPHQADSLARTHRNRFAPDLSQNGIGGPNTLDPTEACHPLGKLPGSVWPLSSEPLMLPDYFVETDGQWQEVWAGRPQKPRKGNVDGGGLFDYGEALEATYPGRVKLWRMTEQRMLRGLVDPMTLLSVDHFAAWPTELVRRILLGWSPHAICTVCGEGRWPVVARSPMEVRPSSRRLEPQASGNASRTATGGTMTKAPEATILGYACRCTPYTDHKGNPRGGPRNTKGWAAGTGDRDCPSGGYGGPNAYEKSGPWREYHLEGWTPPPSRPAVVLDPFVGSGTTLLVANALGRDSIGLDLSADYCRLAKWRASQRSEKVTSRTWKERQRSML